MMINTKYFKKENNRLLKGVSMKINFDDLSNVSDEELINLIHIEEEKGNDGEITQLALKIL